MRLAFYLSILKDKQMPPHGQCNDLENGGSSYSISWSISRFTETQVGINRRDNDNNELHIMTSTGSSWIITLWKVIREWSRRLKADDSYYLFCLLFLRRVEKQEFFTKEWCNNSRRGIHLLFIKQDLNFVRVSEFLISCYESSLSATFAAYNNCF